MADSQTEAMRFVVEKVVRQAELEGVPLSDAERKMLSWSESDPHYVADLQVPERLATEISDEEYEEKVAGLLGRRLAADIDAHPDAASQWEQAAGVLREGDHYITVMLDTALRRRLKRWWQFWR
jgi:hypothetical protein